MLSHRLKLKPDKTEFLWLETTGQLAKLHDSRPELALQNCTIRTSDEAHSLGVIVQSDHSFKRHVQAVSRSSFFQLRHLQNVQHSADNETAATLIHAFVSSRLDLLSSTDTVTVCYLEHQRS